MKKLNLTHLLIASILGTSLISCSSNDDIIPSEGNEYIDNQPTVDEVLTHYTGNVALLKPNNDESIQYIEKRLLNTTNEITENTDVVIMDEAMAANIITDQSKLNT